MKSFFPKSNTRAFTLVELLVVIVIIGILGSVITASLGGARKQARDAKRVSDVKNIAQALEQYYTDKGGYPVISNATENSDAGFCIESSVAFQSVLVPGYLAAAPKDPLYSATDCSSDLNASCHCYIYRTQGNSAKTKEFKVFSRAEIFTSQAATNEAGSYFFEAASPTETAASITPGFSGSAAGNWFGYSGIVPTFSRGSITYKNDGTTVASGAPRFETIETGIQGFMSEEGTTNLVSNANFTSGITNWGFYTSLTGGGVSLSPDWKMFSGTQSLKMVMDSGAHGDALCMNQFSTTAGQAYTASVYIYNPNATAITGNIVIYDRNGGTYNTWNASTTYNIPANGTARVSVTGTAVNTGTNTGWVDTVVSSGLTAGQYVYIAAMQVENKPYSTAWIDGESTRAADSLSMPMTGILNPSGDWTVEARIKPIGNKVLSSGSNRTAVVDIGRYYDSGKASITALLQGQRVYLAMYDAQVGSWYLNSNILTTSDLTTGNIYIALTHTQAGVFTLFTYAGSGSTKSSYTMTFANPFYDVIRVGSYSWATGELEGAIGSVRFSNIVRSDAELQQNALSDPPIDSSTTYRLGLNGSLN